MNPDTPTDPATIELPDGSTFMSEEERAREHGRMNDAAATVVRDGATVFVENP